VTLRASCALLALVAAAPSAAYVRTTANGTGVPLAWPVPIVPWELNPTWANHAPSCTGGAAHEAAQSSFAQWEQGCANFRLLYSGETSELGIGVSSSGRNVVLFRSGWCSQDDRVVDQASGQIRDTCMNDPDLTCGEIYGCYQDPVRCIQEFRSTGSCSAWNVVALTTVLHDPASGRILSADIELVGWDGKPGALADLPQHGWYFTCFAGAQPATICGTYGQGSCVFQDLQNTLTHEAGHFLGLAHPCRADVPPTDPQSCSRPTPGNVPFGQRTMSPTTQPGETQKRTLSSDDVAGVCAIYPEPSGGCGCGGGGGLGSASLVLLVLALRPRRRHATTRPA
jgi:hypothetical protein